MIDRKITMLAVLGMLFSGAQAIAASGDCLVSDGAFSTAVGGGCQDLATGQVWSGSTNQTNYNQVGATNYCANLNQQGVTGWRLPTQPELSAAIANGLITHADTNLAPYDYAMHWTSTRSKSGYLVVRVDGGLKQIGKNSQIAVICVKL